MRYSFGAVGSQVSACGDVATWAEAERLALSDEADVVSVVHDNERRVSHVLRGETSLPLRYGRAEA